MEGRTMTKTEHENSRVGELILDAMEEKGMSIRELSVAVETTYEHIRRIVKGEGIPSKFMLKDICEKLHINYKEAEKAATADRIAKRFGSIPIELSGKNPEMEPLDRIWTKLTDEQKHDLISMAQTWAKRNRALSA
jgi:transcriptional regulator with XRE-family HTH domain